VLILLFGGTKKTFALTPLSIFCDPLSPLQYKQELHALLENRNEHSSVLDITTSDRMKIVKHIRKHEDEIYRFVVCLRQTLFTQPHAQPSNSTITSYTPFTGAHDNRQLWAPYPGFHQKMPKDTSKDPLKDAHEHDVNKGAYFEWHNDPDHDTHGYHTKSLAALNLLSGGLLLRYWPLHKPKDKEKRNAKAGSSRRFSFARMGSQEIKFDGGEDSSQKALGSRSSASSDSKALSISLDSGQKANPDKTPYRRDEKRFAASSDSGGRA